MGMMDHALDYAARGLAVFPCHAAPPRAKQPLTPHGVKDATRDEAIIRGWWERWPDAMIGAAMGTPSGTFAIDPDRPKEDGDPDGLAAWHALVAQHGAIPPTHTHETPSGGRHFLFRLPDGMRITNRTGALPKGIDCRGDGGYVIVAPSKMADGRAYRMADDFDYARFAPAPQWLVDLITAETKRQDGQSDFGPNAFEQHAERESQRSAPGADPVARYVAAAVDRECSEVASCGRGGRNNRLNEAAFALGTLIGAGVLSSHEAMRALLDAASACGLTQADGERSVRATIESGMTAGAAKPRDLAGVGEKARARQHQHQEAPRQDDGFGPKPGVEDPKAAGKAKSSRSAKAPPPRGTNDTRPVIALRAGEIEPAVDAAEAALIAAGGLYQRGNLIVHMGEQPVKTHDEQTVTASRIFEVGEYALGERIASAACTMKWDARADADVVTNPPTWLVKTLQQRTGKFRFAILTAIINAPTLRPDGSLLDVPGYDEATGLFFDPRGVTFPKIPSNPTRRDAERALADLSELLAGFPFVDENSRAVALSGILTACVRQGLPTAPMHGFSAPTAGSGKGKLVDIASVVSTGREAGVIPQCAAEDEMEKRIDAELLEGAGSIAIDNCTVPVDGNKLCSLLTQPTVSIRPLGGSKRVTVSSAVFLSCTGNNLVIQGDMTRRVVVARLDAGVERPELRTFAFEPVARAKAERVRYVVAALTIMLAYRASGAVAPAEPLGSYEKWSELVRNGLLWLGCGDPVATMEAARVLDPKLGELSEVLAHWKAALGSDGITVRRIIEKATRQATDIYGNGGGREFEHPDMREALMAVAGLGGVINGRRLGHWLTSQVGRVVNGCSIEQAGTDHKTIVWKVVERKRSAAAPAADAPKAREEGVHDLSRTRF